MGGNKMARGSIWRRWDLHVHTPESFSHQFRFENDEERERYKGNIWDKYIAELEKINDVSVIGITDYFIIDGYKKVLDYKKSGRLPNFDLILPNIELRLDIFIEGERLDYHVILSDKLSPKTIEEEFLHRLEIRAYNQQPMALTRENIEKLGRDYKQHNEQAFQSMSDFTVGCIQTSVSLDEVKEIFNQKKETFDGNYMLIIAGEGWNKLEWGKETHSPRRKLFIDSHAMFTSNPNTIGFCSGKKHKTPEDFINEFGAFKPCLHGSDAHCFEKLCMPDEDRYCWIKAKPSFDGLRQITCEPEPGERVLIQPDNPEYSEHRKSIYTLSSIDIKSGKINDDLSLKEQSIPLNSYLVAVTGGKGSGKTALLDLIANCFEDRCKRVGEDKNSFIQRIEDSGVNLGVELSFIGENIESFAKKIIENKFVINSRVMYLPQGQIAEFSGSRVRLHKKIEEVIFSNNEVIKQGNRKLFESLKERIYDIDKKIRETNAKIYELEEETKDEIINSVEKEKQVKEGEQKDKQDELENLIKDVGDKAKLEDIRKKEIELRTNQTRFADIKNSLIAFKDSLKRSIKAPVITEVDSEAFDDEILEISNSTIARLNAILSDLDITSLIPIIDFSPQINGITDIISLIDNRLEQISTDIKSVGDQIKQISGIEKKHESLLHEIDNIGNDIKLLEEKLNELKNKKKQIMILEGNKLNDYCDLLKTHQELKSHYDVIINVFSEGKDAIMKGVDFESSIYFDKDRFTQIGLDILDMRRIGIDDIEKIADEIESLMSETFSEALMERLRKFNDEILKKDSFLKGTMTRFNFYEWIFGNYYSLDTKILFNGIPLDKLSMGQKGTVLLKLFLAEGDCPLIIDQPEENLDNKFIYEELVGAFREAKKKRQIIIATNNANLIVNTDAEQIMVAEFENNEISYKSGSLENPEIQKDIIKILEGGKEAFEKREKKYGIHRIRVS
jgi:DNA repair exonuclease SbcCD ATPase subunit